MIEQRRTPERSVFTAGDLVRLTLDPHGEAGEGFVRTNLGFAGVSRREIIASSSRRSLPSCSAARSCGVLSWP